MHPFFLQAVASGVGAYRFPPQKSPLTDWFLSLLRLSHWLNEPLGAGVPFGQASSRRRASAGQASSCVLQAALFLR